MTGRGRSERTTARGRAGGRAAKPIYRIDGAAFHDLEGFYDELQDQLLAGAPWERSLDALDELLHGGAESLPREFVLVWEHADLSRRRLAASGAGSFREILELLARHPNVELVLS